MNLSGESIKDTYGGILNIGATGLTGALTTITDGLGNPLPMQVSETGVNFTGDVTGITPAIRTGSALLFDESAVYGTPSSPSSGNITLAAGTNNSGVTTILIHSQQDLPTFGSEFEVYNSLAYNTVYGWTTGTPFYYYPTGLNGGFNQTVNAVAETSDGKFYVAGSFSKYQGATANFICRINADGTLDTTFDSGTSTTSNAAPSAISAIAVAADDKVYCAGAFVEYQGATAPYLIRLNTDGSLDTSFNTGISPYNPSLIFNNSVFAVAVQSDGKVVAGGSFTSYQGATANRIIRLNTDGTKDGTFNNTTGFNERVSKISLGPTGTIWAQGNFTAYKGTTTQKLVNLSSDGSIAPGWSFTTGVAGGDATIYSLLTGDAEDKCYLGGGFSSVQGATGTYSLARITATGAVDTTFQGGGLTYASPSGNVQILAMTWGATGSTGGIVFNGYGYTSYNGQSVTPYSVLKLTSTGATAAGFSGQPTQLYDSVSQYWGGQNANGAFTTSTGKYFFFGNISGADEQFSNKLVLFDSNGSLNSTFDSNSETAPVINYIGATYFDGTVKYTIYQ